MKRNYFTSFIVIAVIAFLYYLKKQSYIPTYVFVASVLLSSLAINLAAEWIRVRRSSKNINELKRHAGLIKTNPDAYIEELDKALIKSKGYELEYLTLHKANVLAKINRNSEAIDALKDVRPMNLGVTNTSIYYNNLLGLLLKENRVAEADRLYKETKELVDKSVNDKTIAYSIYINRAELSKKNGNHKEAIELLNMAELSVDSKKIKATIAALKTRYQ